MTIPEIIFKIKYWYGHAKFRAVVHKTIEEFGQAQFDAGYNAGVQAAEQTQRESAQRVKDKI